MPWERRAQRTRAYIDVIKRLWCDPVSSYEGEFYQLPPSRQYPKPVQQPHPPIHFGGESDPALRRAADLGQGWFGFQLTPEGAAECVAKLTALLEARGRTRSDVLVTLAPNVREVDAAMIEAYARAGVDQILVAARGRTAAAYIESLERLAQALVQPAAV